MGQRKRHQMMQNLFGDQSEEEEVDSEQESNHQPNYLSDEAEGEVEGHGETEAESEGELLNSHPNLGEIESEREESSQEVDVIDQGEGSEVKDAHRDDKEEHDQRVVTSRRRELNGSGSKKSGENQYADDDDDDDDEIDQAISPSSRSPVEKKDQTHNVQSAAKIRDAFGETDDEEEEEYAVQNDVDQDSHRYSMEDEEDYEKGLGPEVMVREEEAQYGSEEEYAEVKYREKPVGPPLELEIPLRPPPADPIKMNTIKVSNIMGIESKPFDPKTYVEEDKFVTDESGSKKRIRLENNIVRWRTVKKRDGTTSHESNARFVRWSDGSLQLLIGNEVLDISVQGAEHDHTHLFLRHGKGMLQSQGRIMQKMRFMPSSLTSKSHQLLTALLDSRHKKMYKVKNCVTEIDPEKEKEEKEKAENQTLRANVVLSRKREKVTRKYTQPVERRQLSTGYLEGALEEDDEADYYDSRGSRRRFEENLEAEARAEKRIINAKKSQGHKDIRRQSSLPAGRPSRRAAEYSESEEEESEYETDGDEDEVSPPHRRREESEQEYEEDDEEEEADANRASNAESDEPEAPKHGGHASRKRKEIESEEDSPPRKISTHRRMAVVYDSDED